MDGMGYHQRRNDVPNQKPPQWLSNCWRYRSNWADENTSSQSNDNSFAVVGVGWRGNFQQPNNGKTPRPTHKKNISKSLRVPYSKGLFVGQSGIGWVPLDSHDTLPYLVVDYSGQIIIFHQPGFPWNKGISLTKPPFGVRSCEVAIIWPDYCFSIWKFLEFILGSESPQFLYISRRPGIPRSRLIWHQRFRPGFGVSFPSQVLIIFYGMKNPKKNSNRPLEHTPGTPKYKYGSISFINRCLRVWGMFQGSVGFFLDPWITQVRALSV